LYEADVPDGVFSGDVTEAVLVSGGTSGTGESQETITESRAHATELVPNNSGSDWKGQFQTRSWAAPDVLRRILGDLFWILYEMNHLHI
jgi:hypothetical protein